MLSCSSNSAHKELEVAKPLTFDYNKSKVPSYLAIVDSLKPNRYVPCFRMFQTTNFDFEFWKINGEESQFKIDSVAYYESRKIFFNQDKDFLYWLLSFKNDTVVDAKKQDKYLWFPFMNPYSSYISSCSLSASRSKQAISLIYGFLNGSEINCIECRPSNDGCTESKYKFVETFLSKHKGASIDQLREDWKPD